MKKLSFACLCVLFTTNGMAQPRPYETDPTFVPSLEFMQKSWTGEYDGLEPNSKMILSLSRTLILKADLTYTNEVMCSVKDVADEVVLKYETGTYTYDADGRHIVYTIGADSILDVNILLKGEELSYTVNNYETEGGGKTSTEDVQFTSAASDDARQWVLFDQQLMSPIDPRQKAVYVMEGKDIETLGVALPVSATKTEHIYSLDGRKVVTRGNGVYIVDGKKVLTR